MDRVLVSSVMLTTSVILVVLKTLWVHRAHLSQAMDVQPR